MEIQEITDPKMRRNLTKKLRELRNELATESNYLQEKYSYVATDVTAIDAWIHALESLIPDTIQKSIRVETIMELANELYASLKASKQI